MPQHISKSKFLAKYLDLFRQVQETSDPLIITDHRRPVLKIVPYQPAPEEALKALRGSVLRYDDPTEPVGLEDWEPLS